MSSMMIPTLFNYNPINNDQISHHCSMAVWRPVGSGTSGGGVVVFTTPIGKEEVNGSISL